MPSRNNCSFNTRNLSSREAAFVSLLTAEKYSDKNPIYTFNGVISQVHTIGTIQTKYPILDWFPSPWSIRDLVLEHVSPCRDRMTGSMCRPDWDLAWGTEKESGRCIGGDDSQREAVRSGTSRGLCVASLSAALRVTLECLCEVLSLLRGGELGTQPHPLDLST